MKKVINLAPEYYSMSDVEGITILSINNDIANKIGNIYNYQLLNNYINNSRRPSRNKVINFCDILIIRDKTKELYNSNIKTFNNVNLNITREMIINSFILSNMHWFDPSTKIEVLEEENIIKFKLSNDKYYFDFNKVIEDNKFTYIKNKDSEEIIIEYDIANGSLIEIIDKLEMILSTLNDYYISKFFTEEVLDNEDLEYLDHLVEKSNIDKSRIRTIDIDNKNLTCVKCGEYYYPIFKTIFGNLFVSIRNRYIL